MLYVISFSICHTSITHAQIGWQWANASVKTPLGAIEVATAIRNKSGNIFILANNYTDSIIFGTSKIYDNGSVPQMVVAKADSLGNFLWALGSQRTAKKSMVWLENSGIATDLSGNLYVSGVYTDSNCIIGPDTLNNPIPYCMYFMAKFSSSGSVLWAKNIASDSTPFAFLGNSLGVDFEGNIILSGSFGSAKITIGPITLYNNNIIGGGSSDVFLAKFDSLGNTIWAKSFGGKANDNPTGIFVQPNGDFFISGEYTSDSFVLGSTVLTNSTTKPISFLSKLDTNGNPIWAKMLSSHILCSGMTTDNYGCIFLTGGVDSNIKLGSFNLPSFGNFDCFVAMFDSSGNILWAKSAGGPGNDKGQSISVDNCGRILIAGTMELGAAPDTFMNFDGHILIKPYNKEYNDAMFITQYDRSGNYVSGMALSGGGDDYIGIMPDNHGNFYLGGDYEIDTFILGHDTLFNNKGENLFIGKYKYDTVPCSVCFTEPIIGKTNTCKGDSITLFDFTPLGIWNSSNTSIAFVDSTTGVVIGLTAGTIMITYEIGGCIGTKTVTINPVPLPIIGNNYICLELAINLSDALTGGVWSSNNTAVASIDSVSGKVFGVSTGSVIISYKLPTGCFITVSDTVISNCSLRVLRTSNNNEIEIYPNPASTELTIYSFDKICSVEISNILGQIVYCSHCNSDNLKVNIANFLPGMYLIRINGTEVRKFVKQ